jgi:predicted phosphodiesterase
MRFAILSDIHSNLAAFQSVLQDIDRRGGAECIWCLGDVVGYGPDPVECISLLRQYDPICVAGNHDWGALEKIDLREFNSEAAAACRWTGQQLGPDEAEYLTGLSLTQREGEFTLAHGSPREPIWEYLLSTESALVNFGYFDSTFCLVGHSHVPLAFELSPDGTDCRLRDLAPDKPLPIEGSRLIINPGSVGQPRDGDPRASYALYDSDQGTVLNCRVEYDISATQEKMAAFGLPQRLISRLAHGW